jgi:hypothetical protein
MCLESACTQLHILKQLNFHKTLLLLLALLQMMSAVEQVPQVEVACRVPTGFVRFNVAVCCTAAASTW